MMGMPLDRLQAWMQAVVVHPGSADDAVAGPDAAALLPVDRTGEVILPSKTLTPVERLGVYHGMYLLRMDEALATDYPALQHFLGGRAFFALVRDYVQAHPSRAYTLNRLGDHMPEFVKHAKVAKPAFCHDLARLELALSEAFDAPETPCLTEAEIAAVPQDAWERARFATVASFRLLAFRYPVGDYLDSTKGDLHDHPKVRQKQSYAVVYRRDYTVWRQDMIGAAHDLLADLAAGRTLGEAVGAALDRGGKRAPTEDQIFRWFRGWIGGGLFRSLELT